MIIKTIVVTPFCQNCRVVMDDTTCMVDMLYRLSEFYMEEINLDKLDLDDVENPGDMMGKLMGGDFMNIVQSVGTKIQSKISSGDIDSGALLGEARQMISMMGENNQLGEILKNFGGIGQESTPKASTQKTSTRKMERTINRVSSRTSNAANSSNSRTSRAKERLRKKLEQRKNKKK